MTTYDSSLDLYDTALGYDDSGPNGGDIAGVNIRFIANVGTLMMRCIPLLFMVLFSGGVT